MNKAIILTNVQLTQTQKEQLQQTDTFKVALNHHAQDLNPTVRYTSDYIVTKLKKRYGHDIKVYSNRDKKGINTHIPTSGYSIVDCVLWLQSKGKDDILLVADNTVHSKEAQDYIKEALKGLPNVYKFTKDGNFDLPYKDIAEYV